MRSKTILGMFFHLASIALLVMAAGRSGAQEPQFPRGFARPGIPTQAPRDPAESSAYSAAIGEPNPGARVSAIQQFLINYPNSSLRQPAIQQMMLAQRQARGQGIPAEAPAAMMMNRPTPPTPVVAAPTAPAVAVASGPPRDSLLQQPAKRAEITIAAHSLTIKANNSTLSEILHEISGSTGMKIEGIAKDERIFGNYGPGEAREVLMALLDGSGYNVIMLGDTPEGTPRQLTLTQRVATSAGGAAPSPQQANNPDDADDADQDVQQTPQPEMPQQMGQPLPGNPQMPSNDGNQQPRSPQEILQELQRLRQQNPPQ